MKGLNDCNFELFSKRIYCNVNFSSHFYILIATLDSQRELKNTVMDSEYSGGSLSMQKNAGKAILLILEIGEKQRKFIRTIHMVAERMV